MYQLVFPRQGSSWEDRDRWIEVQGGSAATWREAATRLSDRIANGEAFDREAIRTPAGDVVFLDDWLFIAAAPGAAGAYLVSTEFWPEWGTRAEPHNADLARVWARAVDALEPLFTRISV